jgi:riboflavin kinase/FMN adenylyltransferase
MQIFRGINNIPNNISPCSMTIGNFDGVHKGHTQIIQSVIDRAKSKGLKSAILTFADHPVKLFRPDLYDNFLIFNLSQKLKFLKQFNLDYIFILPFNHKIANITANNFTKELLVDKMKMKDLIIGYDFIFGKNREGDFDFLSDKSKELGFDLTKVEAIAENKSIYSSTNIRNFIKEGKVCEAKNILDKDFEIEGTVIGGKKNGRKLGFPTANIATKTNLILPKFGVYKSEVSFDGKTLKSVTNFGIRPTIDDNNKPLFETHILNYNGDLYGKKITVKLKEFIRDEKKFGSLEELKVGIEKDIAVCR